LETTQDGKLLGDYPGNTTKAHKKSVGLNIIIKFEVKADGQIETTIHLWGKGEILLQHVTVIRVKH